MFNMPRIYQPRLASGLSGRMFRVMFGLVFIYVGINMAGDLVRNHSNVNQPIKDAVHRYNAVSIVDAVVSDVGNAIADSFESSSEPISTESLNNHAVAVSASLEGRFREKMPEVNAAFEDIVHSMVIPFQEAIRAQEKNKKSK